MAKRFRFEPLGDLWLQIVTFKKDTWSDRGSLRCLTTPGAGAGQKIHPSQVSANIPGVPAPLAPNVKWLFFWDDFVVWDQNNNELNH